MSLRVGVVADDITGANDIGIMLAKNGYLTGVIPFDQGVKDSDFEGLDAVILETDSRFDAPEIAYQKVYAATLRLQKAGVDQYFNKTCSVFRGNVGSEFDAMADALGISHSMVIAGFPKNGRTTLYGIHYLNGKRLDQSALINDPVHPTTEPSLAKIIQKQSQRKTETFTFEDLDLPFEEQLQLFKQKKENAAYLIFDVRNQEDLVRISRLITDEKNICGSSAIMEELPKLWGETTPLTTKLKSHLHPITDQNGTLVLAGSLTKQTKEQVAYLKKMGYPSFCLDTTKVFDAESCEVLVKSLAEQAIPLLQSGKPALLHTANSDEAVSLTKKMGYERGLKDGELGKLVSAALSKAAGLIQERTGCKRIVVAGGDTSAAVNQSLQISKMIILEEIEPGVPTMYGYGEKGEMLLVYKSGSFGSEEFLHKACGSLMTYAF